MGDLAGPREPPRRVHQPVPPPARRQPGRLVRMGPGGVRPRPRRGPADLAEVGYAACHWCHVMAHESFEDPETAALMNERFINIKVDREERPDIDAIYQKVVQLMGQGGGWPLTVFLGPDQKPVLRRHLLPAGARYGRPSFRQVLHALSRPVEHQRDKLDARPTASARAWPTSPASPTRTSRQVSRPRSLSATPAPSPRSPAACCQGVDREWGGFGRQPKFPNPTALELLLHASRSARSTSPGRPARPLTTPSPHAPRRHLRSPARRLRPLQRRPRVARPALREDALRQRPAARPLRRGQPRVARARTSSATS
jgi:hypothetical protein